MKRSFDLFWKLDGKLAVPCDYLEWGMWFARNNRVVAQTDVGGLQVSTIFIGIGHNFRRHADDPLIFETMIFSLEGHDEYMRRYSTWEEAEAGHADAIEWAKERVQKIQEDLNRTGHPAAQGDTTVTSKKSEMQ